MYILQLSKSLCETLTLAKRTQLDGGYRRYDERLFCLKFAREDPAINVNPKKHILLPSTHIWQNNNLSKIYFIFFFTKKTTNIFNGLYLHTK